MMILGLFFNVNETQKSMIWKKEPLGLPEM